MANRSCPQYATDWIEYDIAFSPNTPNRHPYFSTFEGNNQKPLGPLFKPGTGMDQFGRYQSTGPGIVGLSSTALGKHGGIFTGGKAGN